MNVQHEDIRKYLEKADAQKRVQEDMKRAREEATVTIGRASELFGFSESQLRDWEMRKLLQPRRSKENKGQRLYDITELDKLALLKELMKQGDYSLGNIPPDIDKIWHSISLSSNNHIQTEQATTPHRSIDTRIEEANEKDFWQYYIAQTLRIALNLICEDVPATIAGIILPLERKENAIRNWEPQEIASLGPCLIGWRDQDRSFYTFYEEIPSFDVASDFRVRGLFADGKEEEPADRTFVVLQRKVRNLMLPVEVVDAVRRLLKPIYNDIPRWLSLFKDGPRDMVYSTSVLRGINDVDSLLTFLAKRVIHLGGKNADGSDRWKFSCILLPENSNALLQMRTLIVQAQSKRSPYSIGKTFVSPNANFLSLSQRASQSIHMLFRSPISKEDTAVTFQDEESPIKSAIAMPIGGERDAPLGVLYIVSEQENAFGKEYQRVLRFMGRIISELLLLVQIRAQSEERLRDIITEPRQVNRTLAGYNSENRLIGDIEELLKKINATNNPHVEGQTAFISLDIDDLTDILSGYDSSIAINLSKILGDRVREQLKFVPNENGYQIYHAYSDRFYVKLDNMSLQAVRETTAKLQKDLRGNYRVPLIPASVDKSKRKDVPIENIKLRFGVLWYPHEKLFTILSKYSEETRIADVRSTILGFLDSSLNTGKQRGGDCIISFYPKEPPKFERGRFDLWSPSKIED